MTFKNLGCKDQFKNIKFWVNIIDKKIPMAVPNVVNNFPYHSAIIELILCTYVQARSNWCSTWHDEIIFYLSIWELNEAAAVSNLKSLPILKASPQWTSAKLYFALLATLFLDDEQKTLLPRRRLKLVWKCWERSHDLETQF